jgi:hypothetical protein
MIPVIFLKPETGLQDLQDEQDILLILQIL